MKTIKNCPCCGGEASLFEENFGKIVWVRCTECGLQTSRYEKETVVSGMNGEDWAIMRWNNRK